MSNLDDTLNGTLLNPVPVPKAQLRSAFSTIKSELTTLEDGSGGLPVGAQGVRTVFADADILIDDPSKSVVIYPFTFPLTANRTVTITQNCVGPSGVGKLFMVINESIQGYKLRILVEEHDQAGQYRELIAELDNKETVLIIFRADGWATVALRYYITPGDGGALVASNNLSDVENAATARTNLGLPSGIANALISTNNLSDVSSASVSRSNIGAGVPNASGQANNDLSGDPLFWKGSQAEYNALTPQSNTIYFIT